MQLTPDVVITSNSIDATKAGRKFFQYQNYSLSAVKVSFHTFIIFHLFKLQFKSEMN